MEAGILNMDNILSEDEAVAFFTPEDNSTPTEKQEPTTPENEQEDDNKQEDTTEVNPEELFTEEPENSDEKPESVGSGQHTRKQGGTKSDGDSSSPENTNFYASIAGALKEEGVFPDLDDAEVDAVNDPEGFRDLVNKQVSAQLDEVQQRINSALNAGVEPTAISKYERTLSYLNGITEDKLSEESDNGEALRRQILEQDFMNNGYSPERAKRMTDRLFASGDDVEEAKAALEGNRNFFGTKYKEIIEEAKAQEELEKKNAKKQADDLKKDIMASEKVFGSIPLDKATRQKVVDNITRPVWKDPETGEYYTALQKYRKENPNEYIKNMGLIYTLTNGFTDIESLVKPQTKKEVKSKLRELEHTLNNTARNSSGTLKYVDSGANKASGSIFDRGFSLDI